MFSNMKPVEKRLLEACQKGEMLFLGIERPSEKTADNEIRGEFLRTLILSNNQEIEEDGEKYILKIDPKGIKFSGVYISGTFDFSFQETNLPFSFGNSNFENNINLSDSRIRFLSLSGSKILSLTAYRLVCRSDIILRNIEVLEKVDFVSAQINGDLICKNGKFKNEDGISLHCNKMKIERSVFLDDGFESNGEVNFVSAQIGSILSCKNGKFINENKKALNCNSVKVGNAVFLFDGFKALGNVHFSYSQIKNRLVLSKIRN